MGTVNVLTQEEMESIRDDMIVEGTVDANGDLILSKYGGDTFNAGTVKGTSSPEAVSPTPSTLVRRSHLGTSQVENPIEPKDIVNLQTAQAIVGNPTPTGAIMMWPMPTAPTGYLVCDGSAQSRSIYASLFAVIGTTYGVGDGSSTFNLPNLKGQVPVGLDASQTEFNAVAKSGGAKTVTLTESELAAHNHTQNAHNHLQNAHTHIQDAHTHVQDSHNHTQNSHNHTQNSHNHTQDAHTHNPYSRDMYAAFDSPIVNEAVGAIAGTGFTMAQTAGSITGHTVMASTTPTNQATTPTNIAATATNIAATATNQTTAATSQSTTPTNQSTVATNEPAGGGLPHNNLQPFIVLNYIIKG